MLRKSDNVFLYKISCLLGNGETSKRVLYVQKRENECFFFFVAGPVLESEGCYPLATQRNLDARKYPALRALV
jgi:hypothetical protein